jgi:hypothetical protein
MMSYWYLRVTPAGLNLALLLVYIMFIIRIVIVRNYFSIMNLLNKELEIEN